MMQYSFFDEVNRMDKISELGDTLEQLDAIVNWQIFTPVLTEAIPRKTGNKGGRPPMDSLLMFKILVIKTIWLYEDMLSQNESGKDLFNLTFPKNQPSTQRSS